MRRSLLGGMLTIGFWATGCAAPDPTLFKTYPTGAKLTVTGADGSPRKIGATTDEASTVSSHLEFNGQPLTVAAEKPGYFTTKVVLTQDSPQYRSGELDITLPYDGAYNATIASDLANNDHLQQVRLGMTREDAWKEIVTIASVRYSHFDQQDPASGDLIATPISSNAFANPDHGSMTIRTRLVAQLASKGQGDSLLVLKYRIESQAAYSDKPGEWTPYDRIFSEDQTMVNALLQNIGLTH